MKKIFFLIIFLFSINVKAQEFNLSNEVIRFDKYEDYNLQGFTTTDKYIFSVLVKEDDSKSIIKIYDNKTFKEIKTINFQSLGHANDVTYNQDTNKIYVIVNGSKGINVFDADTFEYEGEIFTNLSIRSLTYIPEKKMYAARTVSTGYYLGEDFNSDNALPFIMGMNLSAKTCRQGWSYYNDHIYYVKWSWIRKGGDGRNTITRYDLKGNKVDDLITQATVGELEDVAFIDDKMLLGVNGYDDYVAFYLEDIPKIEVIENVKEEVKEEKKDYSNLINKIIHALLLIVIIIFLIVRNKEYLKKRLK